MHKKTKHYFIIVLITIIYVNSVHTPESISLFLTDLKIFEITNKFYGIFT